MAAVCQELFRLDHYLAKQAIQNLVRQRITRQTFFDSIWSKEHVESLHVSWKEDIDTEGRGGYFDEFGIVRDIMQNHLLQLFMFRCAKASPCLSISSRLSANHCLAPRPRCLTVLLLRHSAMEIGDGSSEAVAANKVDFLSQVEVLKMEDCVLGQFDTYLDDETVPEGSKCPTYAAVSLKVNTERWKGVPCLITAGKGLSERTCTVEATLKPGLPYKSVLLRIQPDPGLWLIGPNGSEEIPFMEVRNPNRTVFFFFKVFFCHFARTQPMASVFVAGAAGHHGCV